MAETRDKALQDYRKKLLEHKEVDGRLKEREDWTFKRGLRVEAERRRICFDDMKVCGDSQNELADRLASALSCSSVIVENASVKLANEKQTTIKLFNNF